MKPRLLVITSVMLVILAVGTAIAASSRNFRTHFAGRYEVPVRDTQAQGQATFQLNKEGTAFEYKLNVANIENILQAHIHLGPADGIGPIVVWLYPTAPPAQLIPGRFDGRLAEGTITAANLVGPLAGQTLNALIAAMEAGGTYVNDTATRNRPVALAGVRHTRERPRNGRLLVLGQNAQGRTTLNL